MTRLLVIYLFAFILISCTAKAAPPENADPAMGPWFRSLMRPDAPTQSCCSEADCRVTEYRNIHGYFEALIDERFTPYAPPGWTFVPPEKVVRNAGNPLGKAVACWTPSAGILCFVFPPLI